MLQLDIGAHAALTLLDGTLALEPFVPSVLEAMPLSFGSSSGLDAVTLAPAAADACSGTGQCSGTLTVGVSAPCPSRPLPA